MASLKIDFDLEKKKTPREQLFRHFLEKTEQ